MLFMKHVLPRFDRPTTPASGGGDEFATTSSPGLVGGPSVRVPLQVLVEVLAAVLWTVSLAS